MNLARKPTRLTTRSTWIPAGSTSGFAPHLTPETGFLSTSYPGFPRWPARSFQAWVRHAVSPGICLHTDMRMNATRRTGFDEAGLVTRSAFARQVSVGRPN